jgi:hypothetical protein
VSAGARPRDEFQAAARSGRHAIDEERRGRRRDVPRDGRARREDRDWRRGAGENCEGAGVAAGDEIEVTLELDTEPREVALPEDFAQALDAAPEARRFFDGLSNSQKQWFVQPIEGAKTPETRERRIGKAVERLREGRSNR